MTGKKLFVLLLAGVALLGFPNMADCQARDSASHRIEMNVPALRVLYVNETEDITGIGLLSDGISFPEMNIEVKGGPGYLNDKIKGQYYFYLDHPELAGINWNKQQGWHYYQINPQALKDFEASNTNKTLEDGVLYRTITEGN